MRKESNYFTENKETYTIEITNGLSLYKLATELYHILGSVPKQKLRLHPVQNIYFSLKKNFCSQENEQLNAQLLAPFHLLFSSFSLSFQSVECENGMKSRYLDVNIIVVWKITAFARDTYILVWECFGCVQCK
jgi:hypothetical protein